MFLVQQCFAESKHLHKYKTVELIVPLHFDMSKVLLQLSEAGSKVHSIRLLTDDKTPLSLSKLISSVNIDLAFLNACKLAEEISSRQSSTVYITIVNDLPYRALNNTELQETLGYLCERLALNSEMYLLIENSDTLWEKMELPIFHNNPHIHYSKSLNLSYYPLEQISGALTLSVMCNDFSGTIYLPPNYLDTFQNVTLVEEGDMTVVVLNKIAYRRKEYLDEFTR